jgi:DNA-binding MarR family transcriptional regulator
MPDSTNRQIGCTCVALRKLTRTVTRLYDQHLAAAGIKTTQYSLLRWIEHKPLPIAALASRTNTERTTLSRNLKPLIDAGWVVLKPGADARQRIVTITPAGRRVADAAVAAWQTAQAELERTLGADAVRALHAQLDATLAGIKPLLERTAPDGLDD